MCRSKVGNTHQVTTVAEVDNSVTSEEELALLKVSSHPNGPMYIKVTLDGRSVDMELDTGAAISVISE